MKTFDSMYSNILEGILNTDFLLTMVFMVVLFIVRSLLVTSILKVNFKDSDVKRKWVSVFRTVSFILIIAIFFLIWGSEIRSIALSLAAVAVAIVLAFKEIILCFMAGLMRTSSRLFDIGDRITVAGNRGEVTDHNLLVTTLLEIGPGESSNQYTGRVIKLPNSHFLTHNILVTPKGDHYTLKILELPVTLDKDIFKKQEILLNSAKAVSSPYFNLAEEYITRRCKKQGVETPDLRPRVLYDMTSSKMVEFHIRMPMPFNSLTRTENKIKDMFLSECFKQGLEV